MSASDNSRSGFAGVPPPLGSDAYASWLERMQRSRGRHAAITRNLSITTSNLSVTTSNLNRGGLWGIMWSKKPTRSNPAAEPVESPRGAQ